MQRLTVHRNISAARKTYPYLLNVQSDTMDRLPTCVVIPLARAKKLPYTRITRLMPEVEILGESYVAVTPELAGIPRSVLGDAVAHLSHRRDEIVAALDLLLTGA